MNKIEEMLKKDRKETKKSNYLRRERLMKRRNS